MNEREFGQMAGCFVLVLALGGLIGGLIVWAVTRRWGPG